MRVFLLFVDGLGLGQPDAAANPVLGAHMEHLRELLGGRLPLQGELPVAGPPAWAVPTDASLGVPGLPQSATGQCTILSGVNAARAIGRHLNAYPTPNLKRILKEHSLFRQVVRMGKTATFLNAYGPQFRQREPEWRRSLDYLDREEEVRERPAERSDRRRRPSCSTVAVMAAGLSFRDFGQLARGEAVFHDITHWTLNERMGLDYPQVDAAEAGRRAAAVSRQHDFTFFEHFIMDLVGHARDRQRAVQVLETFDRFLGGLLGALDLTETQLIITSDHGNIEDLSVKTHTRNPVPTILAGPASARLAASIRDLAHIAPAVINCLGDRL